MNTGFWGFGVLGFWGAPAYTYTIDAGEEIPGLWEKILEGEKMNFAMSAGSPGVDEG